MCKTAYGRPQEPYGRAYFHIGDALKLQKLVVALTGKTQPYRIENVYFSLLSPSRPSFLSCSTHEPASFLHKWALPYGLKQVLNIEWCSVCYSTRCVCQIFVVDSGLKHWRYPCHKHCCWCWWLQNIRLLELSQCQRPTVWDGTGVRRYVQLSLADE
jgi:hypothetical protein